MRRIIFVLLSVLFSILLIGCGGKAGEKAAIDHVKSICNVPDSFVKEKYDIVQGTENLARMDFKAKNALGVELKHRAYFWVENKDTVKPINIDNVDNELLDYFEKNNPKEFEKCVIASRDLVKLAGELQFESKMLNGILDRFDNNSYIDWSSLKRQAKVYNNHLKRYKDYYETMPEGVKSYIEKNTPNAKKMRDRKYLKVTLNGDVLNWDAKSENTDEFPN